MSCRLLFDEHMAPFLASLLRARGHDALTTEEANLHAASDEAIMEYGAIQDRIILTNDLRDFPSLVQEWNESQNDFAGVVQLRRAGSGYRPGNLISRIEQHITSDPDRPRNSLTWLPPLNR